jgi:hypothetical protein
VYSAESQPAFGRNMSPPSLRSRKKPSKKPGSKQVAAELADGTRFSRFHLVSQAIYSGSTAH